eukprot:1105378-Rhodomonas_salina.1
MRPSPAELKSIEESSDSLNSVPNVRSALSYIVANKPPGRSDKDTAEKDVCVAEDEVKPMLYNPVDDSTTGWTERLCLAVGSLFATAKERTNGVPALTFDPARSCTARVPELCVHFPLEAAKEQDTLFCSHDTGSAESSGVRVPVKPAIVTSSEPRRS